MYTVWFSMLKTSGLSTTTGRAGAKTMAVVRSHTSTLLATRAQTNLNLEVHGTIRNSMQVARIMH